MKTITYIMALISVALLLCLSVSASLASTSQISPGLEVISASAGMTVSAVRGNSVVFEKTDFSDAYRLNGDFSVTVLSLPDDASGLLKLGNTAVCVGQEIGSSSLGSLSFTPSDSCENASFTFTFDDSYTAS